MRVQTKIKTQVPRPPPNNSSHSSIPPSSRNIPPPTRCPYQTYRADHRPATDMSLAFLAMSVLLGSSLAVAFVLQLPREPLSAHQRCQRAALLRALNLQVEPTLPAGQMDAIRAQWKNTFSAIGHRSKGNTGSAQPDNSTAEPGADSSPDHCCQTASQISLEELGWENWVIYPETFTLVQCRPCDPRAAPCPAGPPSHAHSPPSQLQCCQPTDVETVAVVYMDELGSLVISSAALTRACGCGPGVLVPTQE